MGQISRFLILAISIAPLFCGCGKKEDSKTPASEPKTPTTVNGQFVPVHGIWKGNCLATTNTQSSTLAVVEFKASGEMNLTTHSYLLKTDCSGEEDFSYRFTGNYQLGEVSQTTPFTQNFTGNFTSDVYFTLKSDAMLLAFNGNTGNTGSTGDASSGSWKKGVEQKGSPNASSPYSDTLASLNRLFTRNKIKVEGSKLSIGETSAYFTKQ